MCVDHNSIKVGFFCDFFFLGGGGGAVGSSLFCEIYLDFFGGG